MPAEPDLFTPPPQAEAPRTYLTPRRVLFGADAALQAGALAAGYRARRLPGHLPAGAHHRFGRPGPRRGFTGGGRIAVTRHEIPTDPDVAAADEAAAACRAAGAAVVVGVGGGGPLDAAKAVAMLAANPGTAEDYQMGRPVEMDPLPFIAVPTTVGTGSEATMVSVLRNRTAGVVKAIRAPQMIPPVAVLDPLLLAGLPTRLLRLGACDALAHGIESYLSLGATGFTRAHSYEGVRLVGEALRMLAAGGSDAAAGPALLLGSYFAGVALQAGPGLAHVLAQPITAVTGIPHSAAIAALLPLVAEFNEARRPGDRAYGLLAGLLEPEGAGSLAGALRSLLGSIGAGATLPGLGVAPAQAPEILDVVRRSSGHIGGNPVRLDMEVVSAFLHEALAPPAG